MRAHHDDAGVDLYSAESLTLEPGQRQLVRTGIAIEPVSYTHLTLPTICSV